MVSIGTETVSSEVSNRLEAYIGNRNWPGLLIIAREASLSRELFENFPKLLDTTRFDYPESISTPIKRKWDELAGVKLSELLGISTWADIFGRLGYTPIEHKWRFSTTREWLDYRIKHRLAGYGTE